MRDLPQGIAILKQGLPVIGFLKLGEATPKSSRTRGAPRKFDHIELTGTRRDSDRRLIPDPALLEAALAAGLATCGGCERSRELAKWAKDTCKNASLAAEIDRRGLPTEVDILLPSDDPALFFPQRLTYYSGRTAFCVGDGVNARRREVVETRVKDGKKISVYGDYYPHGPCGPECPDFAARRCKPHARLSCVLAIQENVGGCFEFRTTSWNSIPNINGGLSMIAGVTEGRLRWIPLRFAVQQQTVVSSEGQPSTASIANITYPDGPQALRQQLMNTLQLEAPVIKEVRAIEASLAQVVDWHETPEEVEAIVAEFQTEGDGSPVAEPVAPPAIPSDDGAGSAPSEETSVQGNGVLPKSVDESPEGPDDETQTAPGPSETPAEDTTGELPLEAPPPPAETRDEDGDERPRIDASRQALIAAMCQKRARALGYEPPADFVVTIRSEVLTSLGIARIEDVRVDELNRVLEAIETYEGGP